ncbi:hypothetical protein FHK02_1652 [Spirosoma sp. LMG 31448]|uniref:Uncharacterized protein n=1 Tax=Spirosoma utsteinense TaxID=2585773 RepID=A0ABR6W379_9BACT|nr:hypothetical protein [Spirosoma utsteinense]MBC3790573.1 hypothetical protein [Spirosoma utsteinense]
MPKQTLKTLLPDKHEPHKKSSPNHRRAFFVWLTSLLVYLFNVLAQDDPEFTLSYLWAALPHLSNW